MIKTVTLIGLGSMGAGIAENILKAGFDLTVYNRTVAKTKPLAKLGAKVSASPSEAARDAEVVISMVSDDTASREIWLEAGALRSARPLHLLIEAFHLLAITRVGADARGSECAEGGDHHDAQPFQHAHIHLATNPVL